MRVAMFLTLALVSCSVWPGELIEQLAAEVRASEQAFADSMAKRDLDAFESFVAEDAVFFGEETLRGRSAVIERWKDYFEGEHAPFSWRPAVVEVIDSGMLAHSSGPIFDAHGKQIAVFNSVWRRERDGRWKVIFDKGAPHCGPEPKHQ